MKHFLKNNFSQVIAMQTQCSNILVRVQHYVGYCPAFDVKSIYTGGNVWKLVCLVIAGLIGVITLPDCV